MRAKVQEALSLRASGLTKRWHTMPIHGNQSVAEHSAQAISLLMMLHPGPSLKLVQALLWHDSAERVVGDVPAPGKRMNPEFGAAYEAAERMVLMDHPTANEAITGLSEDESDWVRAIDVLELIMFCMDQSFMGNRHADIVVQRGIGYLEQSNTPPIILDFVQALPGIPYRSFA